jgi:hypothetical protein
MVQSNSNNTKALQCMDKYCFDHNKIYQTIKRIYFNHHFFTFSRCFWFFCIPSGFGNLDFVRFQDIRAVMLMKGVTLFSSLSPFCKFYESQE